ncbi:MAG: diacylglycerol/lipid kinase family protein [Candidatus Cryptobacteroides sp.]
MKALFVINPISGKGHKEKLIAALDKRGIEYAVTTRAGEGEELARNATADTVVAVGGDGTLNEVARGILGTGKTLGIVPCGSGDGLARFLGISHDLGKAMEVVSAGKTIPLDAGMINGHPFFSVCGVGFDANVSKAFAEAGKRGLLTYVEEALKLWHNYTPEEFTISIDGQEWTQKAVLVTVANSNQWGNDAAVAPKADCSDGLLDITILDSVDSIELPALAIKLMTGRCDSSSHVHCYTGKHIVITRSCPGPAHYDGDWFEADSRVEISVIPSALKVLVP